MNRARELYKEGLRYDRGVDVDRDPARALRCYKLANHWGCTQATTTLGYLYENGIFVSACLNRAIMLYQDAASQGDMIAQYHLGRLAYEAKKFENAVSWLSHSAKQGYPPSKVLLGVAHAKGNGVPKNEFIAAELFNEAAAQGDSDGVFRLAISYRDGIGVPRNTTKMIRLLKRASQEGHPKSWTELGRLFQAGQIPAENKLQSALECYEHAACLGDPHAQAWCGEWYAMGIESHQDFEKAIPWLRAAVAADIARAKYVLAVLMMSGTGISQDRKEAARLCRDAATSGEADAQFMLGLMYERGDGVVRDLGQASRWFQSPATAGTSAVFQRHQRELAEAQRHLAYYARTVEELAERGIRSPVVEERLAYWQGQVDYYYYAIQELLH